MAENTVRICRLCLNIIEDTNFELLGSYRTGILKTILVGLDISICFNPIVCSKCVDTLQKCYEFKMTCLSSEETVKSCINISEPMKVKPKTVCLKELLKDDESCNGQKICRLCFSLDSEFYTDVNNILENGSIRDMLKCCVPGLNLDLTNDTLMCKECLDLLIKQFIFISDCLESEQKIKMFFYQKGNNSSNGIDLRDVLQFYNKIKSENNVQTVTVKLENITRVIPEEVPVKVESNYNILKTEELDIPDDMEVKDEYSCEKEQGKKEDKNAGLPEYDDKLSNDPNVNSNKEQPCSLLHKDPQEKIKFPCDLCAYVTTYKSNLITHMVVHRTIPEDELLQCYLCEFRCKRKSNLKAHILRAHVSSKGDSAKMFKRKEHLRDHTLLQAPSNSYKCEECSYATNRGSSLERHTRIHKDISEVETFKCDECNFQSKWKCSLKDHVMLRHNPSKVTYKCDKCNFLTTTLRYLKKHAKSHKDILLRTYKCNDCDFETKRKSSFSHHVSLHNY